MQPIVKCVLTKASISSTLHQSFIYGYQSLGGIGLFYPFVIYVEYLIALLIKHCGKLTPYIPLICANLSTTQLA